MAVLPTESLRHGAARPALVACVLLLAACAAKTPPSPRDACLQSWSGFRATVRAQGVADAQYSVVPGYPFLRVNRLLAALADTPGASQRPPEQLHDWLQAAFRFGSEAAGIEWRNLPAPARQRPRAADGTAQTLDGLLHCATVYFQDHPDATALARVAMQRAEVPDAYSTLARVGGYAVARHLALMGVSDLHEEIRQRIGRADRAARKLVVTGPAQPRSLTRAQVAELLQRGRQRSALGLHHFEQEETNQLFAHFAPVLRLGSATASDLVGEVAWNPGNDLEVRVGAPTAYHLLSHTRWRGQILAQLNYVFWFPRRPERSMLDPYAGKLDGLIWRVTLLPDGSVLAYDSIHPCGCYHTLYLPATDLQAREPGFMEEPVLVYPERLPDAYGQRLQLQISAIDHHVIGIRGVDPQAVLGKRPYKFLPYRALRSLVRRDGTHASMFAEDGLVPGTKRGERAYLWPLGVISPGQMRQWGHHATAFVGRRHFDDADLLETLLAAAARGRQTGVAAPQ